MDEASQAPGRGEILWEADERRVQDSRLADFMGWVGRERGLELADYPALWQWSVDDLSGFWSAVWSYFGVSSRRPVAAVLEDPSMPGARWFPGAELNYAEHALRVSGPGEAVVSLSQSRPRLALSWDDLRDQVGRARRGLQRLGVGRGDRVAAVLPNISETTVAFLATASLGAVWTSCAPEFGVRAIVDRLGQVGPRVLLAVDEYRYGARHVDRSADLEEVRRALPTLEATVLVAYPDDHTGAHPESMSWEDLTAEAAPAAFEAVPFDHPLYILYSSGTTGLPKPIVHGHGGILLEHVKALGLHCDLGPGDRFMWFTTTGWMMWNFLVSGLTVGSTVVLFDGDPNHPDPMNLWSLCAGERLDYLGVGAPLITAAAKAGLHPAETVDLSGLRTLGSTGAPLPADGFRWVRRELGNGVLLSSISGGTDVCTAFAGGNPLLAVRAGEIPCRWLGVDLHAFDPDGRPVVGREGELVVTSPMPSMPVGFWGDDDGSRLAAAYFDTFPGVWRHGDWVTVFEDGACVISGRSDATLNRGGVRLGTAEFYAVVDAVDAIADSLVVHLEDADGGPGQLVLLVALRDGASLDDELRSEITRALREALSPRHVPDEIRQLPNIPRTLSGKRLEVPVKRILSGADPSQAASRDSLADPAALDAVAALARDRRASR